MEEITLVAQPRQVLGRQVSQLRRDGAVPLALYGRRIQPRSLQADGRALRAALAKAGHNRLIYLTLGDDAPHIVIAREIQREPITGKLLHVDLQEISLTEKMTVDVPVVLRGTAPAVTRAGGLLIHGLAEVSIRVLPTDLIPEIVVDVAVLAEINQALHVSDLKLGDKIEILTSPDEMLAKVIAVKEEVVAAEAPVATAEVEVVGKGKKEAEAAEAAPAKAEAKPAKAEAKPAKAEAKPAKAEAKPAKAEAKKEEKK